MEDSLTLPGPKNGPLREAVKKSSALFFSLSSSGSSGGEGWGEEAILPSYLQFFTASASGPYRYKRTVRSASGPYQ